ncbi:ABC transporter ATP-binding protein [Chitinophaga arvensicola]|uniref:ABC-2 type transport system ATP-binding protein n=1 Tax=Chitinophaga arvensicola TaxID=29529 RepID=A0A1I0S6Z7_9BACT|nr:ABC transporter ATP-binding protein [Chitinophaga arvensicola]SEW51437.1 ABC-2 type transport system ATP-binding protein [Chitinophaga arvensicola]
MLQMINVRKLYHKQVILDIPSFQLESGIFWLKGANGSGKTTLLKIIAGLIPFEGDVIFHDASLQHQPLSYRQHIGWAEAEPVYPPFMTGNDLVSLYRNIRNTTGNEIAPLLEALQLNNYIDQPVATYSAGTTKKLSLVLSFIGNPALIVLDEPMITLDAEAFSVLCRFIPEKRRQSGTSFLMSSHQAPNAALLQYTSILTVQAGNIVL